MADLTPDDLRRAVALPGFRLCEGLPMVTAGGYQHLYDPGQPPEVWAGVERWPDWTDPMVAGFLLDLLGDAVRQVQRDPTYTRWAIVYNTPEGPRRTEWHDHLGTADVRVALARGEWPGGAR